MIRSLYQCSKRVFDLISSLLGGIAVLPLLIVIAILIKLFSKGPVFYSSKRIGKNGVLFSCYKFRTMYKDADKYLYHLLQDNEELRSEWRSFQKIKKDPRIFPFGRWLRKSSLDELPQLFNVLKGDMSLVGPRPFVVDDHNFSEETMHKLLQEKQDILSVKPGLTGLWQISGRSNMSIEKRLEIEEEYIKNCSFFFDLRLLIKTVSSFFFSTGAY